MLSKKKLTESSSKSYFIKKTIDEVTVYDYEKMVFAGDLSVLVINGNPPESELKEAYNTILYDFTSCCGQGSVDPGLNTYRRILKLKYKIKTLEICYSLVANGGMETALPALKKLRIVVFKNEPNKTLKMIDSKLRELLVKLTEETESYKKESKEEKEFTRDDHIRHIIYLSKENGYKIDTHTTTLREYAGYLASIKERHRAMAHGKFNGTDGRQQKLSNSGRFR